MMFGVAVQIKRVASSKQHILKLHSTVWCSEIGSLTSLDAPELHASVTLTSENQFHCTRRYMHTRLVLRDK